jgi:hypothetical protein
MELTGQPRTLDNGNGFGETGFGYATPEEFWAP